MHVLLNCVSTLARVQVFVFMSIIYLRFIFLFIAYQLFDTEGADSWSAESSHQAENLHPEARTVLVPGRTSQTRLSCCKIQFQ